MEQWIQNLRVWYEARAADTDSTLGQGIEIWTTGGWAMMALVVVCLCIFALGMRVLVRLWRAPVRRIPVTTWRNWIVDREDRTGPVGRLFDRIDELIERRDRSDASGGSADPSDAFAEVRLEETEPLRRDLRIMKIAVGAAPLVGLLGTVTGMLATFKGLGSGGGGDETMSVIAAGIKEALYTTETGLVIALPSLFIHYALSRRFERLRAFLDHVESAWTQVRLETHVRSDEGRIRALVDMLARHEIARRLTARMGGTA